MYETVIIHIDRLIGLCLAVSPALPDDNKGRTPNEVKITQTMLPETVVVPFKYQVVTLDGVVLEETPLELVAGIVGVIEDPENYSMTPKIGWFVRTVKK